MARLVLLPLLSLLAMPGHAGGHFDIDDAGTLDPGQCQYEVWGGRFGTARGHRLPPGPCMPGRAGRARLSTSTAPRCRASMPMASVRSSSWTFTEQPDKTDLSAALFFSAVWDAPHGGRAGGQFVVPVTWHALDSLWINANLGVRLDARQRRANRPRRTSGGLGAQRQSVAGGRALSRLRHRTSARRPALQSDADHQCRHERRAQPRRTVSGATSIGLNQVFSR